MKSWLKYCMGILAGILCLSVVVLGADDKVAETFTGERTISIYLRDMDDVGTLEAQIGTSAAEVVAAETLRDAAIPVKTLILIDNSVSIGKEQQKRTIELVQDLTGGAMEQEQIALATFGEEIQYLTQYSDSYSELKEALTGITYGDQETWLTDVLYGVLEEAAWQDGEENFFRIVIISDGVDSKPVGITKDELYQYIKEHRVPIYTIGCQGSNNEEALENMFALARISGTEPYMLDAVEHTLDIVKGLAVDQDILRVQIAPEAGDMDGGRKTVRIIAGDMAIQTEMRMPQQVLTEEPDSVQEPEPVVQPEPEFSGPVDVPEPETHSSMPLILLGGLLGLAMCLFLTGVFLLVRKRKGDTTAGFESYGGGTEDGGLRDGTTVLLGGNRRKYDLILRDVENPARSFQTQISEEAAALIGRNESCDVCIHYDDRVSGKHCEIGVRGNRFYVLDLKSSNGTFLNENRVITDSDLIAGNILRLGAVRFRVDIR